MTATDFVMPSLGGGRILVLAGEDDSAAAMTAMLRLYGFNAHTAPTLKDGQALACDHVPHVVLLDLPLEGSEDPSVIHQIRTWTGSPAVVVVSGHTESIYRDAAQAAGAAGYLLKPAEPVEVIKLVQQFVI